MMENGRDVAISQLDYKAFGISTASMLRGGMELFKATRILVFDQLLSIAQMQLETTSDPSRMTRHEKAIFDKKGNSIFPIFTISSTLTVPKWFSLLNYRAEEIAKKKEQKK